VSYGGENGFNQAIELASEALGNVKFIQEKKLIGVSLFRLLMSVNFCCVLICLSECQMEVFNCYFSPISVCVRPTFAILFNTASVFPSQLNASGGGGAETRRIFLSPFVSKASRRVSLFFLSVHLLQPYIATGHTSAFISRIFLEVGIL